MKAAPKVELIRQLIRITVCLKGSKVATVETVHNIHKRLKTEKLLLSHTDAPVMFVKLSCVLVLESLKMSWCKSCRTLFSFQQTVHFLRLAPLSSTQCTHFLFFCGACSVTLYFICSGEVKGIGYQSHFEVVLSLSYCQHLHHAALCQLELLISPNNLIDKFFLFLLLSFHSLSRAPCH